MDDLKAKMMELLESLPSNAVVAVATASAVFFAYFLFASKKKSDDDDVLPNDTIPAILKQTEYRTQLKLAYEVAREAGANMKRYLDVKGTKEEANFDLGLELKTNEADICTKIDLQNEELIINGIRKYFPESDILSEEAVGTAEIKKPDRSKATWQGKPTWVIDPIDGTTNFSQGLDQCCISIGYCKNYRPVMGLIHVPATDEWYVAVDGYGAWRNCVPIPSRRLSPNSKKSLKEAVVCTEFGYSRDKVEIHAILGALAKILSHGCRTIRQLGSGCLDLVYVATGKLDVVYAGVVSEGWKPWDYCAAYVICKESGCVMESIEEPEKKFEPFDIYGKSVLCGATRELVDETRAVLVS